MLEKQGLDEFMSTISKGKAVIVSVSPQSRASIAAHFGVSPLQVTLYSFIISFRFSYKVLLSNKSGKKNSKFLIPLD
jgi:iron only hydrogenase large subunit-like protein